MFEGSIVALVTPFKNGEIDEKALERLIELNLYQNNKNMDKNNNEEKSEYSQEVIDLVIARLETIPSHVSLSIGNKGSFEVKDLIEKLKECNQDSRKCTFKENKCRVNADCESWQLCNSESNVCYAKSGYCIEDSQCDIYSQECSQITHLCVPKPGLCEDNLIVKMGIMQ